MDIGTRSEKKQDYVGIIPILRALSSERQKNPIEKRKRNLKKNILQFREEKENVISFFKVREEKEKF